MLVDDPNGRSEIGYPELKMDVFSSAIQFQEFYDKFNLGRNVSKINEDCAACDYCSRVFSAAAEAIKSVMGRFKVEMICGELNKEMSKMKFRSDFTRPEQFPRSLPECGSQTFRMLYCFFVNASNDVELR